MKDKFLILWGMKNLPFEFEKHLLEKTSKNHKILVAVSGGIDSMVLCDLLLKSNWNFSIAHCNFQLRGISSDEDEMFVNEFANENNIQYYSKKFEVDKFQSENPSSTQMAARELRYNWFSELMKDFQFDFLLTAHHLNDSLETFLINLSRGTGIQGLTGIPENSHSILRPLLPFSKGQILEYAKKQNLKWREDATNLESEYARNKIRHHITPILSEIQSGFLNNFEKTISFLKDDVQIIQNHIQDLHKKLFKNYENGWTISLTELKELNPLKHYLFYLFSEYGFKHPYELEKLLFSENNGEIRSAQFRIIKNRDQFILIPLEMESIPNDIELKPGHIIEKPLYLEISKSDFKDEKAAETLDFSKIKFPIRLRKSKLNDEFYPLGMKGKKKVNKFFKDEKFSQLEKEKTWVLVDDEDQILYIVGRRIDDRFKINTNTHTFLNIYLC